MALSPTTMNYSKNGSKMEENVDTRVKIVWFNVVYYIILNSMMLYGIYLIFTSAMWKTTLFSSFCILLGTLGLTAGSHRLWSHRSYKARWPLRALLCVFVSIAAQVGAQQLNFSVVNSIVSSNSIYVWCRDHRVHHKFTDKDADPHNIKRGFFFAHMGWLMCRKHPEVFRKGKNIKLDDLWNDPIIRFNKRFNIPLMIFFCFYLPTMIPVWWWGESPWISFCVAGLTRYSLNLHGTWFVNSAAHCYGYQPFDRFMEARENIAVALFSIGEGWHNYHHAFPWDYSASELGYTLNLTKMFIDFMAFIGLAYDLKQPSPDQIKNKKLKSGDGSRL